MLKEISGSFERFPISASPNEPSKPKGSKAGHLILNAVLNNLPNRSSPHQRQFHAGIGRRIVTRKDREYDTRTHHSNQDNFDRIQADDMKQAATIMAAFVYQTAMMDEKMPRKSMK
ncbi:MAG: hypothetical protein ABIU09_09370 [Pyrinomonadaceae bacterium]